MPKSYNIPSILFKSIPMLSISLKFAWIKFSLFLYLGSSFLSATAKTSLSKSIPITRAPNFNNISA